MTHGLDSNRFPAPLGGGEQPAKANGPRCALRDVGLNWPVDSNQTRLPNFLSRHFVLISLTLRPCPCPAAPCSCWLACYTLLFALVLKAALSSLALGAHRDGLRGLVPFRQPRTLLSVLSLAADVCSTSHRPAKFFLVELSFSNAPFGLTKHVVPTAPPRTFYPGENTP